MRIFSALAILGVATLFVVINQTVHGVNATARSAVELYSKNCASCHGKDGRAKTFKAKFNHARNLTDATWHNEVSDERIFNSISNGRGKNMPSYSKKMTEQEIDSLVSFVRALRR